MLVVLLNGLYGTSVRRAIRWRRRKILKGDIDPWEGCDKHLLRYRTALDLIAEKMSQIDIEIVQSRFNPVTGHIDLCRFLSGEVVAEVEIYKVIDVWHAAVTLAPEIPEHIRECIKIHLPIQVEFVT